MTGEAGTLIPMSAEIVLLHNPHCSKSRALKAALEERGVVFRERLYLEDPLSPRELEELCAKLGGDAGAMVRREPELAEAGLTPASERGELFAAIARTPKLLQRPVLVKGDRAAIGRPTPDAALAIL
jgi:arsenate reductase